VAKTEVDRLLEKADRLQKEIDGVETMQTRVTAAETQLGKLEATVQKACEPARNIAEQLRVSLVGGRQDFRRTAGIGARSCRVQKSRILHKRFSPENVGCFERSGPKRRPSKTGGF
jgi:hypothetical protein